jgi:hypothetical protein
MTTQPTHAERLTVWRQGNPHERLTFDLLLEICDATHLRGANLWGADWKCLQITGLPSGQIVLTPTPDGWELRVGCWVGAIDRLRAIIAQDHGWPEAEGDEITRRRPGLQAALALIDAHIALHPNVINELEAKWGTK